MIRAGGATEVEEKKDLVDNALHATRAAVEEAILPGGGSLLRALKARDGIKAANDDSSRASTTSAALRASAHQIAENAGEDGAWIVGKLLEAEDYIKRGHNDSVVRYVIRRPPKTRPARLAPIQIGMLLPIETIDGRGYHHVAFS